MTIVGGWRSAVAVSLLAVAVTSCSTGSSPQSGPAVIYSGQLPPSAVLVGGAGGTKGSAQASGTTIPLAKQDPTTALFTAIGVFQSCLKGLGVTFSGAPSANNPNSPTNNPSYIKSLTTCAAQSNIVQALNAEKTAQDNLTPQQVLDENKIYIKWRACMISRRMGSSRAEARFQRRPLLVRYRGKRWSPIDSTARREPPDEPRHRGLRGAGAAG